MPDYSELRARVLARFEGCDYDPNGPTVFAWHVHHDRPCEPLTEPIANRVDYITAEKEQREIPTRLEWLRPVRGDLPGDVKEAGDKYRKARDKYLEAGDKCREAWDKYQEAAGKYQEAGDKCRKARDKYQEAAYKCKTDIEALYAIECPGGPWDGEKMVFARSRIEREPKK